VIPQITQITHPPTHPHPHALAHSCVHCRTSRCVRPPGAPQFYKTVLESGELAKLGKSLACCSYRHVREKLCVCVGVWVCGCVVVVVVVVGGGICCWETDSCVVLTSHPSLLPSSDLLTQLFHSPTPPCTTTRNIVAHRLVLTHLPPRSASTLRICSLAHASAILRTHLAPHPHAHTLITSCARPSPWHSVL
jgi:hypothetical protein